MKKDRVWLYAFFAISIILWLVTYFTAHGDPIYVYGDPHTFNSLIPFLTYDVQRILFPIMGVAFAALCFVLAWITMGKRPAISMLAVALFIAFLFEDIGIRTGLIFGPYFHTTIEGVKLGTVPVFVICIWVFVVYVGWTMGNLLIDGSPIQTRFSVGRIIGGAVVGAMVATTMDLGIDPFAAANGWWVWINGGPYVGVPLQNYVGWVALGTLTLAIHGFDFRQHEIKDLRSAPAWKRNISVIPVVFYGLVWVTFTLLNMKGFVGLVVFFAMGIPFLAAFKRWLEWNRAAKDVPDVDRLVPAGANSQAAKTSPSR